MDNSLLAVRDINHKYIVVGGKTVNRIEKVREAVDAVLLNVADDAERRCGYAHLYGVSQACVLIALKRGENAELAATAGMLHDIHTYAAMDPRDHAHKGAAMARDLLEAMKCFEAGEIDVICSAVYHHSSKEITHAPFDEVLKDADVMQHCLYNPLFDVMKHETVRFGKLKAEFGLA